MEPDTNTNLMGRLASVTKESLGRPTMLADGSLCWPIETMLFNLAYISRGLC